MKVVVIGGGFAGLAAATRLADEGQEVTLVERQPRLGGRAWSTVDETTGDVVDNGPHLLLGSYRATRAFLQRIGAAEKLVLRDDLRVACLDRGVLRRAPASLPPPFGLLAGLARFEALSWTERLLALRVAAAVRAPRSGFVGARLGNLAPPPTDGETVDGWLDRLGQATGARRAVWHPLTLAALNDDPRTASARLFESVLREILSPDDGAGPRFAVSRVGLSQLYCDDAARHLEARGGRLMLGADVDAILVRTVGRVTLADGVRLANGDELRADAVIAAVPPGPLLALLPPEIRARERLYFDPIARLRTSPLVTVHLWLDRVVIDEPFFGLLDSPFHWAFHRNQLAEVRDPSRSLLSLVASAARGLVERPESELSDLAFAELRRALPSVAGTRLEHARVFKERDATLAHPAGADHDRPKPRTPVDGLFLAGDWVRTGLPATIESAVRSAEDAAEMAMSYEPPPPPAPPRGFVPVGNLRRRTSG